MYGCSKIRHIAKLRQLIRLWRKKAARTCRHIPSDVPAGHIAVSVGVNHRRFVVRATYLNHPVFMKLLDQAEEEYGFNNSGPLLIPCDELVFEEILRCLSGSRNSSCCFTNFEEFHRYCHLGLWNKSYSLDFWTESRPLLNGLRLLNLDCDMS